MKTKIKKRMHRYKRMNYWIFKNIVGFLLIGLTISACESKSELEKEIAAIPIDIEIVRFDKVFAEASLADLPSLKKEYPMFFPKQYPDSIWEQRISDTLQIGLNKAVLSQFPSENELVEELASLFQHVSYYYGGFKVPKVYTTTSDVDYKTKVIAQKDVLVIELDTYLGSEHPFYVDLSRYIVKHMKPEMIISDVATAYSRSYISIPKQRSLLAQMIYFGKELYLKDLWLPEVSDANKIGYTEAELAWAKENESDIWRYFVEKEILYSTDAKLPSRFINPAPFSKFNLELDNDSPGMIGRYIGWQMVRSYVDNNDIPLEELMRLSPEILFKNSKYKPKK